MNKHWGVKNIFLLNEDELLYGLCVKKNPSVLHQPAYLLGYAYVGASSKSCKMRDFEMWGCQKGEDGRR
jgi:hypothetical protein